MLIDRYNRRIDYLRISVTDRCNLRCVYCMPECGIVNKPHEELLTFEEIARIVEAGADLGITKVRLTGGEPLVRKNITALVRILSNIKGIKDISMTTNGILLERYAFDLKEAGLKRLNISLDSLDAARYKGLTRFGDLADVKRGISKAWEAGLSPIKINVLLLNDISKEEVIKFLRLTIEDPVHVRFLEFMPVNSFYKMEDFISARIVLTAAEGLDKVEETENLGCGPARAYRFEEAKGTFGIISPMSDKFCASCNRLRLTSDGNLKACLHSDIKVNLLQPLRSGADKKALIGLIESVIELKPREHELDKSDASRISEFSMCQIGG